MTFLLLACTALPSARAATLIYSNDVLGDLEPCGCRSNPLGGMARKYHLLKKQSDELIQVDAGNLMFASNDVPEILHAQTELQASYVLKALELLGHDVITPGTKEFSLGVKVFDRLRKGTKIPFIAANLKRSKGGKFLEPSVILERKGADGKKLRVAVLGLVGEALDWPKELKASSAIATAKKLVPQLRKKADFVIALTHQGFDADQKLALEVKGIDLIVGGHSQSFLQNVPREGTTWIYQSSFRNQYIGVVPLVKPFENEGHRLVALDAGYDTPKDTPPSEMDKLVSEFKVAVAKLNEKDLQKLQAERAPSPQGNKFHTFPKCAECHLKQFDFWRKTAHANALEPLMEKEQFRNKECLTCHSVGLGDPEGFADVTRLAERRMSEFVENPVETQDLAQFLKSMHKADSLKSKVKLSRSDEDAPLPLREAVSRLTRSWTPVQCENCHQPGREHPFSGAYSKLVSQETCFKCHTSERAPEWYKNGTPDLEKIAIKRKQITCPAGDLTEEELN